MENICLISLGICFLFGTGWFATRLIDWYEGRKGFAKDAKTLFLSDLFKIQLKWMKRGEISYAEGLGVIIKTVKETPTPAEMELAERSKPQTQYGRDFEARIKMNYKDQIKQEVINDLDQEIYNR